MSKVTKGPNGTAMQFNEKQEAMAAEVRDIELKARYWKGQVDVMKYAMEFKALSPAYQEHLEQEKKEAAEAQERFEKAVAELNTRAENGEVQVDEADKA